MLPVLAGPLYGVSTVTLNNNLNSNWHGKRFCTALKSYIDTRFSTQGVQVNGSLRIWWLERLPVSYGPMRLCTTPCPDTISPTTENTATFPSMIAVILLLQVAWLQG